MKNEKRQVKAKYNKFLKTKERLSAQTRVVDDLYDVYKAAEAAHDAAHDEALEILDEYCGLYRLIRDLSIKPVSP